MPGVGLVSSGTAADAVDAAVRCVSLRCWWRRRGVCQETFEDTYLSRRSPEQLRGCSVAVLKRYCSSRGQFGLSRAVKWRTGAKTLLGAGAAAAAAALALALRLRPGLC